MEAIQNTNSVGINNPPEASPQKKDSSPNGFSALQWALLSLTVTLQKKAVVEVNSEKALIADQVELNNENNQNNFVPIPWNETHRWINVVSDSGPSSGYWEAITPTNQQLQDNSIANEQVEKVRSYVDGKSKVDQQLMQVATANNSSTVSSTTQATDLYSSNNDAVTKSAEAIARA